MDSYKWIFKWKKNEDGDVIFIPIVAISKKSTSANYLAIWKIDDNKFVSSWWYEGDVAVLKDAKPKLEDIRNVFRYVFKTNNFFERL